MPLSSAYNNLLFFTLICLSPTRHLNVLFFSSSRSVFPCYYLMTLNFIPNCFINVFFTYFVFPFANSFCASKIDSTTQWTIKVGRFFSSLDFNFRLSLFFLCLPFIHNLIVFLFPVFFFISFVISATFSIFCSEMSIYFLKCNFVTLSTLLSWSRSLFSNIRRTFFDASSSLIFLLKLWYYLDIDNSAPCIKDITELDMPGVRYINKEQHDSIVGIHYYC